MERIRFDGPTDPYLFALHCIGGKWKMTILYRIFHSGKIRFNQILRVLPISEKVLSQQLKEMVRDGLVQRIVDGDVYPPSIEYSLTEVGQKLIPALDELYIWSVRQMDARNLPIDRSSLAAHPSETYEKELIKLMKDSDSRSDTEEENG